MNEHVQKHNSVNRSNVSKVYIKMNTFVWKCLRFVQFAPFPPFFSPLWFSEGVHRLCNQRQAPDPVHAAEPAHIPVPTVAFRGVTLL